MMYNIKVVYTVLACLLGHSYLFGQVIINPVQSNIPVLSLDQLKNVQLVNTGNSPIAGKLLLEIKNSSQVLLEMESAVLQIPAGGYVNKSDILWNDLFAVEDPNFVYSLMISSNFQQGAYVYCYKFIDEESNLVNMRCLENYSTRMSPPELKFPHNQSTIFTTVPQLRWLNPVPVFGSELSYSIKLVKVEKGQGRADALVKNLPLLERRGLKTNFYQYSALDIPLERGSIYAWKVVAMWNENYLGETSEWSFRIGRGTEEQEITLKESYRSLKQKPDGTSYKFTDRMYVRYINKTNSDLLEYTIYEKGDPNKVVKRLPKLELKPGLNQLIINLKPLRISAEVEYVLEIKESHNRFSYLQFSTKK